MARKGLGKGLDSLIPEIYDENFDSNSPQSLEDLLSGNDEPEEEVSAPVEEEKSDKKEKNIFEEIEEENEKGTDFTSAESDDVQGEIQESEVSQDGDASEEGNSDIRSEENVQDAQKIQVDPSHIDEVTQIVDKNPRITLWSSRSAAVLRYLRKTEPEFSISKEASTLIDEAVSKKYPEIWELFDQY